MVRPSAPGGTPAASAVNPSYALPTAPWRAAWATSSAPNWSRNQVSAIPPVGQTGQ